MSKRTVLADIQTRLQTVINRTPIYEVVSIYNIIETTTITRTTTQLITYIERCPTLIITAILYQDRRHPVYISRVLPVEKSTVVRNIGRQDAQAQTERGGARSEIPIQVMI